RRRQERASARTGEKFAFVTLSDPSGEYEVLFQPEALRKYRENLEPGQSVIVRIRCKGSDGDVRFFGEAAEPMNGSLKTDDMGMRVHVSARHFDLPAFKASLDAA